MDADLGRPERGAVPEGEAGREEGGEGKGGRSKYEGLDTVRRVKDREVELQFASPSDELRSVLKLQLTRRRRRALRRSPPPAENRRL